MSTNKIFTSEAIQDRESQKSSYYRANRVNLLTKDIAKDLNTYRNWKQFDLTFPTIWDEEGVPSKTQMKGKGVKSLFSPVVGVYGDVPLRESLNIPLLDSPKMRESIKERTDCSIKALVKASEQGKMGRAIYN